MTALPVVSGRDVAKALARIGFDFDRQRGSHIILRHPTPPFRRVVVPDHKEVAKGTLRAIIRHAGLNDTKNLRLFMEEYSDLTKGSLVLCTGEETFWIADRILAVPWWRVV